MKILRFAGRAIVAVALALLATGSALAQFVPGQVLTAQQLNNALTSVAAASLPIVGGTLSGPITGTAATFGTGSFASLSASGTISGSAFSTYLASPPALGASAPNTGAFTSLSASTPNPSLLFQSSGTGGVARTISDKLQDTDSVFDFMTPAQIANVKSGAASIDVSGALQACVNFEATKARGGTCGMPPGMYLINSTIRLTAPNVRLQGAGKGATVIATNANITDVIVGTNPITGIVGNDILDIGFFHSNAVAKTVPSLIMLSPIQATVRASFTNGAYGMVLYGGQGVKLDRIVAPGNYNPTSNPALNSNTAITLSAASSAPGYTMGTGAVDLPTEVEIASPYINGPFMQGWQYGVFMSAGEHVTFTGDYYVGQSTIDNVHIEQGADNKLILETTLAPGGYIDGAGRAGVWVGGPNGNGSQYIGQFSIYATVKGQSGSGLDGIVIDGTNRGGAYPQAVINAVLSPTQVSGWARHGMNLAGGQNISIPSPNVFGNSFSVVSNGSGIVVGPNASGVRVRGGRSGGGTYGAGTGNQAYGISIDPASTNVTVNSVDLTGNQASSNGVTNAGTSANQITDSPGFNGNRAAKVPTMPASGVSYTNPYGSRAQVLIYGGTVTSINLNGQQMFSTSSGVPPISVAPADVLSITYSATPSWIWWPQ
ncbi:hypothetical protein [Burkholderia cepacia]|uniref:hypothetical protein n=1 Tax=Burkholderia cepacia TaxID=292 RepID=UPI000F5FEC71|nr:hypothetical protein [Burkholderia cepacia]RRA01922.1 hypothetical protein DF055_20130 [Burkholderia cepacia]RRA04955.1 hypothetical protein DF054_22930 [Burkholderia cepacia]